MEAERAPFGKQAHGRRHQGAPRHGHRQAARTPPEGGADHVADVHKKLTYNAQKALKRLI